jgi:hypothetical protein
VTVEIPLTQGLVAIVDDEDAPRVLAEGKWYAAKYHLTYYAMRNVRRAGGARGGTYKLHNFVTGWPYVDHIDGNGLDCTRGNLRQCNHAQNRRNSRRYANNTSGFKGVGWDKRANQWRARITVDRTERWLGNFTDPRDAALAYDAAARELHGPFARLNFPEEQAS